MLETKDPNALAKWFDKNSYHFPTDSAYILEDYVKNDWYFVACKIRPELISGQTSQKLKKGHATPLKLVFKSNQIIYPLKISSIQAGNKDEETIISEENLVPSEVIYYSDQIPIIIYVLADGKKSPVFLHNMQIG